VILNETPQVECLASRHIGMNVSNAQFHYNLQRLWNPRTQKGLFLTLPGNPGTKLVSELLQEADKFFERVEKACEELRSRRVGERGLRAEDLSLNQPGRNWSELRIRRSDLVQDNLTMPIQRLREAVSEAV